MKKLAIVGNKIMARLLKKYIDMTSYGEVCAYVVDKEFINELELDGINVISFEAFNEKFSNEEIKLIMGIAYSAMGNNRKKIFEKCKQMGYKFENYIHPTAIVPPDLEIGEGNNILEGVIIEAGVSIGNANLFFGGSMVGHDSNIGDYNTFAGKSMIAGFVTVENNCFLGVSSAVKNNITLHNYVLIGAMAFGYKNMEEYSVVIPARSQILEDKKSTDYM